MKQETFERSRQDSWNRYEAMLEALERGPGVAEEFPEAYRAICRDLALADDRGFGASLVDRLNGLTLRGHQQLYAAQNRLGSPLVFLGRDFPRAVRQQAALLGLVSLLFYGSTVLFFALDWWHPDLVYHFLSGEQVVEFEGMYDPSAPHYGAPRDTVGDFGAFSFYIYNNIGVAFRTFAGGIFFGLGSFFFISFNGVFFGLVAAHLSHTGFASTFFPFVIGHGSFELTAIVLAGAAGARIGLAVLTPGRRRRLDALRRAAREVVPILYGLTLMLAVAAVIEAFWSSSRAVSAEVKLAVGLALWLLVAAWLGLGGRRHAD